MNFGEAKLFYTLSCIGLALIILLPLFTSVISLPSEEPFSNLWLLGVNHMIEQYPFRVAESEPQKVYLGVDNHLSELAYYVVYVKLRNEAEALPNNAAGLPSALVPVLEYRFFLADNETWEKEVTFSIEGVSFQRDVCRVSRILIDDISVEVDKVALQDEKDGGFYYELVFELWIYNPSVSGFQYHNRFVGIWLNLAS